MRTKLSIIVLVVMASLAVATSPPEYEKTEHVILGTTHAIIGQLASCSVTNEPGSHVLNVTIKPVQSLWGSDLTNSVAAKYREFIPHIPEGMSVCFANYTGSGIEWKAKPKEKYICFLKKEKNAFSLLRLEPVENKKKILELYKKQKEKTPTKPSTATE